jgi:hypothetical protein
LPDDLAGNFAERLRVGGERGGKRLADGADLENCLLRHRPTTLFRGDAVVEEILLALNRGGHGDARNVMLLQSGRNARSMAALIVLGLSAAMLTTGSRHKETMAIASGLTTLEITVN